VLLLSIVGALRPRNWLDFLLCVFLVLLFLLLPLQLFHLSAEVVSFLLLLFEFKLELIVFILALNIGL
jgi:hypothetical protein